MEATNTHMEFGKALDQYEKHKACGEYAEAREQLREAIMLCPYPTVVRRLRDEYATYHIAKPWNFWSAVSRVFGRKEPQERVVQRVM